MTFTFGLACGLVIGLCIGAVLAILIWNILGLGEPEYAEEFKMFVDDLESIPSATKVIIKKEIEQKERELQAMIIQLKKEL